MKKLFKKQDKEFEEKFNLAETFLVYKYLPHETYANAVGDVKSHISKIREETLQAVREMAKCNNCKGDGFTAEHDPNDMRPEHFESGDCQSCPVQVQCDVCHATGLNFDLLKSLDI